MNGAGEHHTYALQFDGSWVSGLPDLYNDINQANGSVTPAIQAKAVAIPPDTVVTDASDSTKQYVFKQLQVSEYLATVSDPGGLDLTLAGLLDLSTVPSWVPTGLGDRPTGVTLKYSEGNPVKCDSGGGGKRRARLRGRARRAIRRTRQRRTRSSVIRPRQ